MVTLLDYTLEGYTLIAFKVAVTLAVAILLERTVKFLLSARFSRMAHRMGIDTTAYNVVVRTVSFVILLAGVIISMSYVPQLRSISQGIFLSAGVIGIVVGLAVKDTFSNFFAGLFIAFSHPFRVGDTVRTEIEEGIVEEITLRHTVLRTWTNERVVIPNETMNKERIVNYDLVESPIRRRIEIGISYDSDIDRAKEILQDEAEKNEKIIREDDMRLDVMELGESAVKLRMTAWTPTYREGAIAERELLEAIKHRFDAEPNITVPFPQRTLSFLNNEAAERLKK